MIQSQEVSTVMAVVNDVHSSSIQIRSEGDVCVCVRWSVHLLFALMSFPSGWVRMFV